MYLVEDVGHEPRTAVLLSSMLRLCMDGAYKFKSFESSRETSEIGSFRIALTRSEALNTRHLAILGRSMAIMSLYVYVFVCI